MSSASYSPSDTLLSLPIELQELTLIYSALYDPLSVASIAQSCQYFYTLVYKATDTHLWREIFLTTFDDPRPLEDILKFPFSNEHSNGIHFDWHGQFTSRMSARKFVKRYTSLDSVCEYSQLSKVTLR